ncbi:MAG: DUF393 domain-containing protein [Paracoccaceae bacterium]
MTSTFASTPDPRAAARVFYDGGCPVCRREIGWYTAMPGGEQIEWLDISIKPDVPEGLPSGTTTDDLMRRFTIARHDGAIVSGGPGFIALWRGLGPLRWLGRLTDHAPGRWAGEVAYRCFLRLRRLWR